MNLYEPSVLISCLFITLCFTTSKQPDRLTLVSKYVPKRLFGSAGRLKYQIYIRTMRSVRARTYDDAASISVV